ncbi:MAG: DUF4412 domain-containing protein [bacterium]|nr:DUF4412 domain-containing protein [bacterium]
MKHIPFLIIIILISAIGMSASEAPDTAGYVKEQVHSDGYYNYGKEAPESTYTRELWISGQKLAVVSEAKKILVDTEKKSIIIINRKGKSYVESTLPLEFANVLPANLAGFFTSMIIKGNIKSTGENKTIDKWKCMGYAFTFSSGAEDSKSSEIDSQCWYTTDVPFDIATFHLAYTPVLQMRYFGPELLAKVAELKGFPVLTNTTTYTSNGGVKSNVKLLELAKKPLPADIFSIPEGFTKKEKLTYPEWLAK